MRFSKCSSLQLRKKGEKIHYENHCEPGEVVVALGAGSKKQLSFHHFSSVVLSRPPSPARVSEGEEKRGERDNRVGEKGRRKKIKKKDKYKQKLEKN